MTQFNLPMVKDLGLQREVMDALPYAVVGGAYKGSFDTPLGDDEEKTVLTHIVPAGQQLKILFLRVWTQEADGAKFSIYQTSPAEGEEGHPVKGSVVYDSDSAPGTGYRDYPMLEAKGSEVLHGSLRDPIHVLEGSVDFRIEGPTPTPATGAKYGVVWWGVEKVPE